MERRDRSLEALNKLIYIDSLDSYERANALEIWANKYLNRDFESNLDLNLEDFERFLELFYKNINFLKQQTSILKQDLENNNHIKKFFS